MRGTGGSRMYCSTTCRRRRVVPATPGEGVGLWGGEGGERLRRCEVVLRGEAEGVRVVLRCAAAGRAAEEWHHISLLVRG